MKKLIVSAAVMMTVIAASQSEARSLQVTQTASLTKFDFQNASSLSNKRIKDGSVQIHFYEKTITLKLNPSFYCPPNLMCAQVMPRQIVYQVNNFTTSTGPCNERVYMALDDRRPVDGMMTSITVIDNSTNTCKYFAPVASTEVTLEVGHPRGGVERHQFEAEKLN